VAAAIHPGTTSAEVVVIGGGIQGCSTALHLALRGVKAAVIEKDYLARHASGVNAGGVRTLSRHPAEIPLSIASMELWRRMPDLVDDDCGFDSHGQVKVAENEAELEVLRERHRLVRGLGYEHEELIGPDELRDLVPAIAPHCTGALVCRTDGAALPFRTVTALRRKAEALGARFFEGTTVTGLQRRGPAWRIDTDRGAFEAANLVNTAGAWAHRIAAMLGEEAPVEVIAPMLMVSAALPPFLKPVVGATGRPLTFKQFANGTAVIGGGYRGSADLAT
jgi:sarcosine oxidase subunit beta